MNWGKWIVAVFILFVVFIGVLAGICFRQDVSLVSAKYYEEDLQFQQQYDQLSNANTLKIKPAIQLVDKALYISYQHFSAVQEGTLKLIRPGNSLLDHSYELSSQADSVQQFNVPDAARGLYKVQLTWKEGAKQFRLDKTILL
jgi:hypothetical protein